MVESGGLSDPVAVLFTGTFYHGIDEKGRIIIPVKLRTAVQEERDGSGFWMARGFDGCIFLYTPRDWEALRQKVQSQAGSVMDKEHRNIERMLFSQAEHGMCDRQGRIVLPEFLKRHAQIEKEVVISGVGQRIEIWAKEKWEELIAQTAKSFEDDAQRLYEKDRQ